MGNLPFVEIPNIELLRDSQCIREREREPAEGPQILKGLGVGAFVHKRLASL